MNAGHDACREDVRAHVWRVHDSLRGGLHLHEITDVLAANAVEWKQEASGRRAPDLSELGGVRRLRAACSERIASVLEQERRWLGDRTPDEVRRYLPAILGSEASRDYGQADFTTSEPLVRVVITSLLAYEEPGRTAPAHLYDPVCGTGTLALSAAEALSSAARPVSVAGQEANRATWLYARAQAFLADADTHPHAVADTHPAASFSHGDVLREDAFPGRAFDYAVAHLPSGLHWHAAREAVEAERGRSGGRFPGGTPAPTDAALLFTQILVSKLRPAADGGGRAVVLTAPQPLTDRPGSPVRDWLVTEDLVEAVIALPEGLSAVTDARLHALVLSTGKPPARRGKIRFVDLRGFYDDAFQGRAERRTVNEAGLRELSRSLISAKESAHSRTVAARTLRHRRVAIAYPRGSMANGSKPAVPAPVLETLVPVTSDLSAWRKKRYGCAPPEVEEMPGPDLVLLDTDRVFRTGTPAASLREIASLGWPTARLAELVRRATYIRSAKAPAPEREAALSSVAGHRALVLPVEPHADAVSGDPAEVAPPNRVLVMRIDDDLADADYLAGWLNSPVGRRLRAAAVTRCLGGASPRTVAIRDAWRMADDIPVALPPLPVQRELARAEAVLDAAGRRISDARKELWREPRKRSDIYREASRLTRTGDLTEWAHSLPMPVASALWALEATGDDVHARHRQMFLFWDAAVEFHAVVVLSALWQDGSRLDEEARRLAERCARVGLSAGHASLGFWRVVLQSLTKTYRRRLAGEDADERARVRAAFADPPQDFLDNLLGDDVMRTFNEVIERRNAWSGHGGAAVEETLNEQLDVLTSHVHALRNAVGTGWTDYPLVRAGGARKRDGVLQHEVELAMGPGTPFRRERVPVADVKDEGGLYLLSRESGRTLPLAPLVRFRPAEFGASGSCYFYNRTQKGGVRFVSYHDGRTPEFTEDLPDAAGVADIVRLLTGGGEIPDGIPDGSPDR